MESFVANPAVCFFYPGQGKGTVWRNRAAERYGVRLFRICYGTTAMEANFLTDGIDTKLTISIPAFTQKFGIDQVTWNLP